ncbi:hypothetical protein CWR43_16175 [Rhizobium sullae]|uniref:Uncharacterized protein n=2 Tax=Rhizobium sullae TaxID=50338 RepID=A0A2N0D986_RHISU|nr:hypothetical protein CWR43_16175 [Rhizobium sullae]
MDEAAPMTNKGTGSDHLPDGIRDHRAFQRRVWIVQRAAWFVFGIVLISCLFGALGKGGYLSRALMETPQGTVDYPAISRWNAPDEIHIRFGPGDADRVFIADAAFLKGFFVEGIDPPPKAVTPKAGLIHYQFPGNPGLPVDVRFRLHTQSPGFHRIHLGIGDHVSALLVLILP